jgi:hypothetical protein
MGALIKDKVKYERLLFFVAFGLSFVHFSMLIYVLPLLISSMAIRVVILDSLFALLIVLSWKYMHCRVQNLLDSPAVIFLIAVLTFFTLASFLQGILSGDSKATEVFKEFRNSIYFIIPLGVWASSPLCGNEIIDKRKTNLVKIIFIASLLGTATYIICSKILIHIVLGNAASVLTGGAIWSQFISTYGEEVGEPFSHALMGKFKSTPFIVAFLQCMVLLNLIIYNKISKKYLYIVLLGIIFYVAFISNLRAILFACLMGSFIALMYGFFSEQSIKRVWRAQIKILMYVSVIGISLVFFFILAQGEGKFQSEVLGKGLYSKAEQSRSEATIDVFNLTNARVYGFFGQGLGQRGGKLGIDSGWENIAVSFGYIYLLAYLLLFGISFFCLGNAIINDDHINIDTKIVNLAVLSGVFDVLINNYSHSHLLFIPDAIMAGILLGYGLSTSKIEFGRS